MPEGHSIHRAARDQRPLLVGQRLAVSSPQGRFAEGSALIDGRTCTGIDAYGKHLLYRFDEDALHIHLGLFGRFRSDAQPAPEPRGLVRVRLESPSHVVDINGPNQCEVLDPPGMARLLAGIGPDVLRADADPERAFARITRSRVALGQLIMDQSVMAGIGNIYRTELLWRQQLHPLMPGKALGRAEFDALWAEAARLLAIGVELGAIVTVDKPGRGRGYRARLNIFKKPRCPRCRGPIRRIEIAARSAYLCDTCQPPRD